MWLMATILDSADTEQFQKFLFGKAALDTTLLFLLQPLLDYRFLKERSCVLFIVTSPVYTAKYMSCDEKHYLSNLVSPTQHTTLSTSPIPKTHTHKKQDILLWVAWGWKGILCTEQEDLHSSLGCATANHVVLNKLPTFFIYKNLDSMYLTSKTLNQLAPKKIMYSIWKVFTDVRQHIY